MKSRLDILLDLLHRSPDGALATQSLAMPGFPFATALPFATDECHRPVFLISQLAEHTQNLQADPRASLLVRHLLPDGEMARVTVVGNVQPIHAEPLLVARYLRYQPEGERFLQLGDFRFFRLEPIQARTIGGFAQAGWLAGERLTEGAVLPLKGEVAILEALRPQLPSGTQLLGVDCHGVDLTVAEERRRIAFADGPKLAKDTFLAAQASVNALQR